MSAIGGMTGWDTECRQAQVGPDSTEAVAALALPALSAATILSLMSCEVN